VNIRANSTRSLGQLSIIVGALTTALLLALDLVFPAFPTPLFLRPGWIAIIFMCGFDGCGDHKALAWLVHVGTDWLVYSVAIFAVGLIFCRPQQDHHV